MDKKLAGRILEAVAWLATEPGPGDRPEEPAQWLRGVADQLAGPEKLPAPEYTREWETEAVVHELNGLYVRLAGVPHTPTEAAAVAALLRELAQWVEYS